MVSSIWLVQVKLKKENVKRFNSFLQLNEIQERYLIRTDEK